MIKKKNKDEKVAVPWEWIDSINVILNRAVKIVNEFDTVDILVQSIIWQEIYDFHVEAHTFFTR